MKLCMMILLSWLLACPVARGEESNSGIDQRGIDRSVRPQDDLFLFGNGQWLKHTRIPPDKPTYGAFEILGDQSQLHVREIIEDAVRGEHPHGSDEQKMNNE